MIYKIGKKQLMVLIMETMVLIYAWLYLFVINSDGTFVKYSQFGIIVIAIFFILFMKVQRKIFTAQTVFLILFILFQFGLPVVYAFNPDYNNFYLNLFDEKILANAAKFSIMATLIYICISSLVIADGSSKVASAKSGKWEKEFGNNQEIVAEAALLLFIVTAVAVIPVNLMSAFKAMAAGITIGNTYRGAMSANGFTRFFQEFYFSSALLFICFSDKKVQKQCVSLLYLIVAFSLVVVADRSGGFTALVVYALYKYYSKKETDHGGRAFLLVIMGILLAGLSAAIANMRIGSNVVGGLSLLYGALEEMGFNFTSLCFVMDYIPSNTNFRFGMSYLVAVILLIPKTLGLAPVYPKLQSYLGETWLWNANKLYGRDFLSFGVGFSIIAESYYNFSWAGVLVMIPMACIITHFLKERKIDSRWSLYMRLVLMLNFFTVPRRQFQSVLKGLEYSVFFTGIYLLVYISAKKRR